METVWKILSEPLTLVGLVAGGLIGLLGNLVSHVMITRTWPWFLAQQNQRKKRQSAERSRRRKQFKRRVEQYVNNDLSILLGAVLAAATFLSALVCWSVAFVVIEIRRPFDPNTLASTLASTDILQNALPPYRDWILSRGIPLESVLTINLLATPVFVMFAGLLLAVLSVEELKVVTAAMRQRGIVLAVLDSSTDDSA